MSRARTTPLTEFGEYFQTILDQGLFRTKEEACKALGYTPTTVRYWMNGTRRPTVTACERIGFVFGVPIDEVRAAAGQPIPTTVDAFLPKDIRSLMRGIIWSDQKFNELRSFLEGIDEQHTAETYSTRRASQQGVESEDQ